MQEVMIQPALSQAERKVNIKNISAFKFQGPRSQPEPSGASDASSCHGLSTAHWAPVCSSELQEVSRSSLPQIQHPPAFQSSSASYRIPVSCKGKSKTCTPNHSRKKLQHRTLHLALIKFPQSRISLPIPLSRHQISTTWVYFAKQSSSHWQIQA